MILVTGGTGLVGSYLLYKLTQTEDSVRALYRSEEKIASVKHVFSYFTEDITPLFSKIDWVKGDILDIPLLEKQFKDISTVYHCAALVSFDPNDYHALRKINIEGTANIVNLCIAHKIDKLCYVSSIAAIGEEQSGQEITEESPWNSERDHNVYAITKYGAEMEVWRGTQEGLNAVIVNPGIILGAGFWRSASGSLFRSVQKGMSYFTQGTSGYVDVHDVVDVMIKLMKSTITNKRYIVVSENWMFKEFTEQVAHELNIQPPKKEASPLILNIAWRLDWLQYFFLRKRRRLTKQMVASISAVAIYSNTEIKNAIGFQFKPLNKTIKDVCALFLKEH